ncbi:unnamed protein product [Cutaneotrichosporon oleaginosum]
MEDEVTGAGVTGVCGSALRDQFESRGSLTMRRITGVEDDLMSSPQSSACDTSRPAAPPRQDPQPPGSRGSRSQGQCIQQPRHQPIDPLLHALGALVDIARLHCTCAPRTPVPRRPIIPECIVVSGYALRHARYPPKTGLNGRRGNRGRNGLLGPGHTVGGEVVERLAPDGHVLAIVAEDVVDLVDERAEDDEDEEPAEGEVEGRLLQRSPQPSLATPRNSPANALGAVKAAENPEALGDAGKRADCTEAKDEEEGQEGHIGNDADGGVSGRDEHEDAEAGPGEETPSENGVGAVKGVEAPVCDVSCGLWVWEKEARGLTTTGVRVPLAYKASSDGPDEKGPEAADAVEEEVNTTGRYHCDRWGVGGWGEVTEEWRGMAMSEEE